MASRKPEENIDVNNGSISPASVPDSPPGENTNPPGERQAVEPILQKLQENMSSMTQFLSKICDNLPIGEHVEGKRRQQGRKRSGRRHNYTSSEEEYSSSEPPAKRANLNKDGDSISVTASDDDVRQLLNDPSGQKNSDTVANNKQAESEDELLKELDAALKDEDKPAAKINQQLADIVNKRWGNKLAQDKIATIWAKHAQPENCSVVNVTRVNTEIWGSLNAFQKKADLRMANLQQALQKATFATLSNADKLLTLKAQDNSASPSVNVHEMLGNCIDTVALLGHAVAEISQLRREKLKPSLKSEYHILCSAVVAPESKLLFGDDLAKQIRDRNETNRIGNTVASVTRDSRVQRTRQPWHNKHENYKGVASGSGYRQPYFRKGYQAPKRKKTKQQPTNRAREEIMRSLEKMKLKVGKFSVFVESSLTPYLKNRCDTFKAGCIAHSLPAWKNITSDNNIISTVMGMKINFENPPTQHYITNSPRQPAETLIIDSEIQKLLSKQVIEPTRHCKNEVISDIFVREKKRMAVSD